MIYNKDKVKEFLPHREPFLFVDSIQEIKLGHEFKNEQKTIKDLIDSTIIANYKTDKDHPIFAGHFPGNPILPGVVQIEMMAQASSFILTLIHDNPFILNMEVALLSVLNAKFRKPILPEMELEIRALMIKARSNFSTYQSQIFHNGILMSEVEYMASTIFK